MRFFTLPRLLAFLLVLHVFSSCKKDISNLEVPAGAIAGIPTFPLNWENTDYMPTPAGTTILVPWASGSVKGFTSDIWYDYRQFDGWELVYNTFNTTSLPSNPFFVLYNKYRGLLRYYIYITTSGFTTSSYLTTGLNLAPNSVHSPMLNYATQDWIDVNLKPSSVTKIEPTQIASGTWYAAQYEIAYDPGTSGYSYSQLGLNLTLKWTNVTQVSLGGTSVGTIKGTITTGGSSFNLGSQVQKGAFNAAGFTVFNSAAGPDGTKPENNNLIGLPSALFKATKDGLTSGLVGVAKNILNGIINGGSGPTIQSLNATINTDITLTGSETNSGAIFPDPGLGLNVPGTSNSSLGIGYIPAYNDPLGVFNISEKPTIQSRAVDNVGGRPSAYYYFTLMPFTIIANPAVSQVAQVEVEKQEMVLLSNLIETDGVKEETHPIYPTWTGLTWALVQRWTRPAGLLQLGVRVIVKVTPNNGSAPLKIVKTFRANEVRI